MFTKSADCGREGAGLFKEALGEFKKVRTITTAAMLIAIAVVLSFFTIAISEFLKVGLAFIPKELMSALFGPFVGAVGGGITDVIQYAIKPTGPYFFGWTLNAILIGFVYGFFLYKKEVRLWRVAAANGFELLVNLFLTTWYLTILYGNSYVVIFPMRAVKNLIQYPINVAIFYALWKVIDKQQIFKEKA